MRTRHVLYAGPAFSGRTTSLEVLCPRRPGPGGAGDQDHVSWLRRLSSGVDVTLSSGIEHVCFTLLDLVDHPPAPALR